jgi:dipeptidyl aminopeptidase/acylaminoacyl peptidase
MIGERSFQRCSLTVDKTIDEGWADKDNLLITGGSYAGYLTAWIISHDNRFKAACAQRGVYDLNTFFLKEMHGD